jgi:hypothetical protein
MPVTADYTVCAQCHKTTTDEWQASRHGQVGLDCEACHNSHSQEPRAETVNELCTNCHKDTGSSFTHGTHANSGLSCSDCHMSAASHSRFNRRFVRNWAYVRGGIRSLHQLSQGHRPYTRHHRFAFGTTDRRGAYSEELEKMVSEKDQAIQSLEAQNTVRLYTGLIQGSIVGLIIGGVAAWVVSQRIRFVEVEENDDTEEKS